MQMELDPKLNAMDRLYNQMIGLIDRYQKWHEDGWPSDGRAECITCLRSVQQTAEEAGIFFEETANALLQVLSEGMNPQALLSVEPVLEQLLESIKKMYLACMHDEGSYQKVLLENYYQTDYDKTAILFYLIYPFLFPQASYGHTNQAEVKALAGLLRDRGYNVDLANTRYTGDLEYEKYQLVIGSGSMFEQICSSRNHAPCICYLTESSPYFSNVAELKRLNDFRERNHIRLPFERQSSNFLNLSSLAGADAAICIGNMRTAATYEGMFERIFPINATGFSGEFLLETNGKETDSGKNFLWYGGAGPVHKGLDLCIEAFRMLPDLKLHIVGEMPVEFYEFYRKDIEEGENILYYGFLGKDAQEFRQVCRQCGFHLSPSCSEGQSTSVITSMLAGIVPVCTRETGLDMDLCGGFWIEDIGVNSMAEFIRNLSKTKGEQLRQRQEQVYRYARENHSIENYKKQLTLIFDRLLDTEDK